jgi:CubicO group peptidase (beta-lactamase class C family)
MKPFRIASTVVLCCAISSAVAQTREHWAGDMIVMLREGMAPVEPASLDSAGLDSFIVWAMGNYNIPGVAACVVKDGQVVWSGAHGWAIIEDSIAVTDSTLFMLASVSKTVTGAAVMQLWEEGHFGLDDNINDYLPFQVIHPWHPDSIITFRMLLTHTSAINDNWGVLNALYVLGDSPIPLGQFLEDYLTPGGAYYHAESNFSPWAPGTTYDYCNVAVALAGYLVEAISGTPFDQYCEDSLFTPLHMDETAWFLADLDTSHIAMPYHWNGSTYVPYRHYGYPDYPDGQLRSGTAELSRFLIAMLQGGQIEGVRILDSTTVDTMTTVQVPNVTPSSDIGIIWHRYWRDCLDDWIWVHGGSDAGVRTEVIFCPAADENWGCIVLTNGESYSGVLAIEWELLYFAHDYVCPMVLDIELLNSTTARLSWSQVTGATHYSLYRRTTPHFLPGGLPWRTVAAPTTSTDFTDGIGGPGANYYFLGVARNAGQASTESNIVGECDFSLSTNTAP